MALTASPPPHATELSTQNQELSDRLDLDILRVRKEIEALTKRKNLLVSSLLSNTKVQSQLNTQDGTAPQISSDQTPLHPQAQHNKTNIHRLTYGVTAFPFTDPNPDTSDRPLLGVRFDIPNRSGRFEKAPYYVFLKRVRDGESGHTPVHEKTLKIHHHTIPALVPLQDYADRYLPQPPVSDRDEGYFGSRQSPVDNLNGHARGDDDREGSEGERDTRNGLTSNTADLMVQDPGQHLHEFVSAVQRDLMSWQMRHDAISLLAEQVGVASDSDNDDDKNEALQEKFVLQSVQVTAVDARFCRLVWENGTVGRLRLTDDGFVDKAIVIGDNGDHGKPERLKNIEQMLCTGRDGERLEVAGLLKRLEEVGGRMRQGSRNESEDGDEDGMELDATS